MLKPPPLARPPGRAAQTASWWLAGLITLCDWIGSAVQWFGYEGDAVTSLEQYWPRARQRAEVAVAESGLLPARPGTSRGIAGLMPQIIEPTPMQALAETLPLPDGPISVIVEDATGGGKTEAALVLAQRLIADGCADGLFIAPPTMATADVFPACAGMNRRIPTSGRTTGRVPRMGGDEPESRPIFDPPHHGTRSPRRCGVALCLPSLNGYTIILWLG